MEHLLHGPRGLPHSILNAVHSVFVDENYVYAGMADGRVFVLERGTWKEIAILGGHKACVPCVFVDNDYIYSASEDETVRIWTKGEWKESEVLNGYREMVIAVHITDQYLFSGPQYGQTMRTLASDGAVEARRVRRLDTEARNSVACNV